MYTRLPPEIQVTLNKYIDAQTDLRHCFPENHATTALQEYLNLRHKSRLLLETLKKGIEEFFFAKDLFPHTLPDHLYEIRYATVMARDKYNASLKALELYEGAVLRILDTTSRLEELQADTLKNKEVYLAIKNHFINSALHYFAYGKILPENAQFLYHDRM